MQADKNAFPGQGPLNPGKKGFPVLYIIKIMAGPDKVIAFAYINPVIVSGYK